ncbi:aminotransferase class I/II-fold pyridoxal phosphate-dependent enzyme [Paenibacillus sp. CF384]|uniref:aminotransferase class I/II-fold pyridoxal phosphate-dependent enzyme n=1 Tax=Paenibacillus sp. CF384 TaxID=1884382 RepID=UPI0008944809|nr:aminotransferase class I/II-fold pyridoxal phosphate-dependent enzyme [Paenibacillus sp. CF384]SDX85487.1 Arginine/lysine/ornithine decarboxylase [Paenibacillus sp. CF384]
MADTQSKQWHAPLFDTLTALQRSNPVSFHVPGHKYGQSIAHLTGMNDNAVQTFQSIMRIDVTEISGTDDLHAPSGIIQEAQTLAAEVFGADQTFFLVGGSTVGNLAMLLAACRPGDLVIVQRNAHKSVLNGLMLAGASAVFIMPQKNAGSNLDVLPDISQVEEAMAKYPDAKAVFLTNPSYYGLSIDLEPYAKQIHAHGMLLLVDEAHGAHYGLHPAFPRSAIQAGADAVVQSTHKTLPALTMGAMLHVQGQRIHTLALADALRMIQSSSPSYPIIASLDMTRAMLQAYGSDLFEQGIHAARRFRAWIKDQSAFETIIVDEEQGRSSAAAIRVDPIRVILREAHGRLSGFDLQQRLEKYGCYAEMADLRYVVLLFGLAASDSDVDRLQEALHAIAEEIEREGLKARENVEMPIEHHRTMSEPVVFTRSGVQHASNGTETIPLSNSAGRYTVEAVIPYPPGIPLLYEGERITEETIIYIQQLMEHGARCQGASDPTMQTITVLRTG